MAELVLKSNLTPEEKNEIRERTIEYVVDYLNPGFIKFKRSADSKAVEWHGEGVILESIDGRRFVDFLAGYGALSLGHRHPRVLEAVKAQLERTGLYSQELLNATQAYLAKKLAEISPGDLKCTYYFNGGAEAVEAALKVARINNHRKFFVVAHKGFHGKTLGALSATQREVLKAPFRPLLEEYFIAVPYDDPEALRRVMTEEVCAVLLEPIQGEGGINIPSAGYFAEVRKICNEFGSLLIADEIQTGFGRTGKMFCVEHWETVPDIIVLGKSMGGGVMPISAVHGKEKLWEPLEVNPWYLTNTFGGNSLSCAAALAAIDVLVEEELPEAAAHKGSYLLGHLRELQKEFPEVIQDVRGKGLFIGVEFHDPEVGTRVARELFESGILVAHTINNPKAIRIEPPLIIGLDHINILIEKLGMVLKSLGVRV